jgi:anti-anti-sigma factor
MPGGENMPFEVSLVMIKNNIAIITLVGDLDSSVAQQFMNEITDAAAQNAKRLVLMVKDLEYMASAGLRALIFAKQKMGSDVDIYIVGAQDTVKETITMTGFHHSVFLLDEYDTAVIETI